MSVKEPTGDKCILYGCEDDENETYMNDFNLEFRAFAEKGQEVISSLVSAMKKAYEEEKYDHDSEDINFLNFDEDSKYNMLGNELIEFLIEQATDTSYGIKKFTFTPSMYILTYRRVSDVIDRLTNLEADINAYCLESRSRTALIYAMLNDYDSKVIGGILKKGAEYCCCVLHIAVSLNIPEVVKLLIDFKGDNIASLFPPNSSQFFSIDVNCDCCEVVFCRFKQTIDILVERGFDLTQTDGDGNTVLHEVPCSYLISLALKSGLSINMINYHGLSPLDAAIGYQDLKQARRLIMFGADSNCLDQALEESSSKEMINLLIYNDAHISCDLLKELICRAYASSRPLEEYNIYLSFKESCLTIFKSYLLLFDGLEMDPEEFDDYILRYTHEEPRCPERFYSECLLEISNMQEELLTDSLTFHQFCMMKKTKRSKSVNIPSLAFKHDYEQIRFLFPMYKDIIILRIKDNQKVRCRRILRKSLEKIIIRPVSVSEDVSDIQELDYDCWYYISSYLCYQILYKLFNLAIESDDPSFTEEKTACST